MIIWTFVVAGSTALRIAFDETWLVAVTRKRLAGEGPRLVAGASLAAIGKLLLHHGGCEDKAGPGHAKCAPPYNPICLNMSISGNTRLHV